MHGYTVYWAKDTLVQARRLGMIGMPLTLVFGGHHYSHPDPVRSGLVAGDVLYPVTVCARRLHVLSSLAVEEVHPILDDDHAYRFADERDLPVLGGCLVSAMLGRGTPLTSGEEVPEQIATALAFQSRRAKEPAPVKGVLPDGTWRHVNGIHGVHRLAPDSAEAFRAAFPPPTGLQ